MSAIPALEKLSVVGNFDLTLTLPRLPIKFTLNQRVDSYWLTKVTQADFGDPGNIETPEVVGQSLRKILRHFRSMKEREKRSQWSFLHHSSDQ